MTLTRRRDATENLEQWSIWDGDVRVGMMRHVNTTGSETAWQWSCWGGETGAAESFDGARAEFQKAWDRVAPTVTEAERDAFRYQEAFTAWKYAMWDAGCRADHVERRSGAHPDGPHGNEVSRRPNGIK